MSRPKSAAAPAPALASPNGDEHPDGIAEPHRMLVDARPAARGRGDAIPAPALRSRLQPSAPGPDGRPRAPRREVEVPIPGYDGFLLWIWSNYPRRLAEDMNSGEEARITGALRLIAREHNGWCDPEGEPYPPADDPGFYDAIPLELGVLILHAINGAPAAYPNSLSPTGGR